jgi:acyl carrier protein
MRRIFALPHEDGFMDMNWIQRFAQVRNYMTQRLGMKGDAASLHDDDLLFSSGLLDSLGAIEIIMCVDTEYRINLFEIRFDLARFDWRDHRSRQESSRSGLFVEVLPAASRNLHGLIQGLLNRWGLISANGHPCRCRAFPDRAAPGRRGCFAPPAMAHACGPFRGRACDAACAGR